MPAVEDQALSPEEVVNIASYIQPDRMRLPLAGVGRHAFNIYAGLARMGQLGVLIDEKTDKSLFPREVSGSFCEADISRKDEVLWKLGVGREFSISGFRPDVYYSPVDAYITWREAVPTVLTMHDMHTLERGLGWTFSLSQLRVRFAAMLWMRSVFSRCSHIIVVSEFTKKRMMELLDVPSGKITVTGNGVSENFKARETPLFSSWSNEVLVIGGLRVKKGGAEVIEAAKELERRRSRLRIIVVGGVDDCFKKSAESIRSLEVAGRLADGEMIRRLQGASSSLFLSPYEGFGMPVVEAMAAGVPAICARRGSLPEVAGGAAILVEPKSTGEIVNSLHLIDQNRLARFQFVEKGLCNAARYSWERICSQTHAVLERVVKTEKERRLIC